MGASAVFGILGTFAYPALRKRVGLLRTGIFALSFEIMALTFSVASIWLPGSPFDPLYLIKSHDSLASECSNETAVDNVIQVCFTF